MPQTNDSDGLKVQLKEIRDRLDNTAHLGRALQAAESELSLHIQGLDAGNVSGPTDQEVLQEKLNSIEQEYNDIISKNQISKLSESALSHSPKKNVANSRMNHNQSAEDVSFASHLSEQFLVEARKMREEIHAKDKLLEEQAAEREKLYNESKDLRHIVADLRTTEERIKDENWNLELKVQELTSKVSKSDAFVTKISGETGKLSSDKEIHISQIENLRVREAELKQELDRLRNTHDQQLNGWQKDKDKLENENILLQKSLSEIKQELSSVSSFIAPAEDESSKAGQGDFQSSTEDDDGFKTPTNSPPQSPVGATPARNSALENETIKSSLQHSHRQITSLKNSILKDRSEKTELRRQVNELQSELERAKTFAGLSSSTNNSSSNVVRTKRSKYFAKQSAAVKKAEAALGRRGDSSSSSAYATAESDMGFETAQEEVVATTEDEIYLTGNDNIDGQPSSEDTETEQESNRTADSRTGFFHEDPAIESTASLSSGSEGEQSSRRIISRRSTRIKRGGIVRSSSNNSSLHKETNQPSGSKSLASEFLSIEELYQHAGLHGLVTVAQEDYDALLSKSDATDINNVENSAEKLGYTVIPKPEYEKLMSNASNISNTKYLTETALPSVGLVALASSEYEKLLHPTADHVVSQAHNVGLKAIPIEDHERLVHPSKEAIFAHAHGLGFKAVPIEHYQKLTDPSEEDIHNHASRFGLKVIAVDEHERLKNPTATDIQEQASALGLTAIHVDEHKRLVNPSVDDIHKNATGLGLKAISVEEHERLVNETTRQLTKEEVEVRAKDLGLLVIPSGEYFDLVRMRDSPSPQLVSDLAKKIGMVPVEESVYESWNSPSKDILQYKADSLGLTVVETIKYKDLTRMLKSPSPEEVTEKANKLGLQVLPQSEFQQLTRELSRDELETKAKTFNAVIIDEEEYKSLEELANRPSAEHVISHAIKHGLVTVPEDELKTLRTQVDEPDAEHVKTKAAALGLAAISVSQHKELMRRADSPSTDELHAAAAKNNMVVLDKEAHEKLVSPALKDITNHAAKQNHAVILQDDLDALNNPTKADLEAHALKNNLVVLPSEEYQQLNNYTPTQRDIEEHSSKFGLVVVPKDQFEKLSRDANVTIDKSFIASAAAGLGLATITHESLSQLKAAPSLSTASDIVTKHGQVVIPAGDLKALKNPTVDQVINHAKTHGLVTLSEDEYKSLKKPYEPSSSEEIEKFAEKFGLVTLPVPLYTQLSAAPTKDKIAKEATGLGLVVVGKDELEELNSRPKEFNPTREELAEFAERFKSRLVSTERIKQLEELPSKEIVEKTAESYGLRAIPISELEDLKRKSTFPSAKELETFATGLGQTVVPLQQFQDLHERAENPTKEKLYSSSNKLGLMLLATEELTNLRRRAENPTVEELREYSAKTYNHALVPQKDIDEFNRYKSEPTRDEVKLAAESIGLVAISKDVHEELEKNATEPDLDTVTRFGRRIGHSTIPTAELDDLRRKISQQPSKGELEIFAKKLNMVVLPRDQYTLLSERAELQSTNTGESNIPHSGSDKSLSAQLTGGNMPSSPASAKNMHLQSVAAKRDHFEQEIRRAGEKEDRPVDKKVVESMRSLGYVPVAQDEYKRLLENQQVYSPTKVEIIRAAKTFGLTAIAAEEYRSLLRRNHSKTNSVGSIDMLGGLDGAKSSNVSVGSSVYTDANSSASNLNLSRSPPLSPTSESGHDVEMKAVPAGYLASLRRIAENPTKEDVTLLAKKAGVALAGAAVAATGSGLALKEAIKDESTPSTPTRLPSASFNRELSPPPIGYTPSIDEVKAKAKEFGLVSLTQEEHKAIQQPPSLSEDEIRTKAKELGLVSLSEEEHRSLQNYDPSAEEIKTKAKGLHLITLSDDEYENLQSQVAKANSSPRAEDIKAQALALGFVTVPADELETLKAQASRPEAPTSHTEDEVRSFAKALGLTTLPIAAFTALNNKANAAPTSESVSQHAKGLGLVSIPQKEYDTLRTRAAAVPTREEIRANAESAGLIVFSTEEYNRLQEVDAEKVEIDAQRLGLVTVPISVYEQMYQNPTPVQATAVTQQTEADIRRQADNLGLLLMNREQLEEKINARSAVLAGEQPSLRPSGHISLSRSELEGRARDLGLVVIDTDDYKRLSTATVTGPALEGSALEGPSIKEVRKSSVIVNPANSGELIPTAAALSDEQSSIASQPPHAPLPAVSESPWGRMSTESSTSINNHKYFTAPSNNDSPQTTGTRQTRNISTENGSLFNLSAATIASQASLTDRNMIPYITQVVIGEFLHKYTRRIAVSGISDTRHERYFWVHPYSLTLHWTKENPGSQMRHNPKTKSAAIVSIKSVEDHNPLPPGLYHKSILITTNDRVLKITCPNRRRHNIWYNSLQYLIKRSTDELSFEDEDAVDDYVEDRHMEQERARTASALSHRTSGGRVLSIRRSVAPEMNNNHIKSLSVRGSVIPSGRAPSVSSYRPPSLMPPPRSGANIRTGQP